MLDSEKTESEVKTIISNVNTLNDNLSKLARKIFTNNLDPFLTKSLTQFGIAKRYELSPEHFAIELFEHDNISRYYRKVNGKMKDISISGRNFKTLVEKKNIAITDKVFDWVEGEQIRIRENNFGKFTGQEVIALIDDVGESNGRCKLSLILADESGS